MKNAAPLPSQHNKRSPVRPSPPPALSAMTGYLARQRAALLSTHIPILVTLPLRAFLGITFLYAGIQKLTDPGFFHAHAPTYIGTQIAGFAHHSPIGGFLTAVALPHAVFFGGLIAWGEVAIGLGTLAGALFRPAAAGGALLSTLLWLSATWQVKPYFLGSDIFAIFGWLTLLLAGTGGVFALDPRLGRWLAPRLQTWLGSERADGLLLALGFAPPSDLTDVTPLPAETRGRRPAVARYSTRQSRRDFINGAIAGAVTLLTGFGLWNILKPASANLPVIAPGGGTTAASGNGAALATLANLPTNSALTFTLPSNQDPGVLVRLPSGSVVAFDATCTHAGCTVQYDTGSQHLLCPCHGAEFDPAHQAAVIAGPTNQPLAPVAIAVDQQTGAITLQ